jgi:hypothetical protein
VGCGDRNIHAVKGAGCVRFQLESRGFLELAEVLFVLEFLVNLRSVLYL